MRIKTFLLDKNIVSLLNNKNPMDEEAIQMLDFIRSQDNETCSFSAIPSIIEGRIRRKENNEELRKTIALETQILEDFFTNASTDIHVLKSEKNKFSEIFSQNSVLSYELEYKAVLKKYYERLMHYRDKGSVPKNSMKNFAYEIIRYTEELGLPKENPIILLIIIDIYQITDEKFSSFQPRNVLHPKKKFKTFDEKVHNVYSDMVIAHLLSQLIFRDKKNKLEIEFLTCDKALKNYLQVFKLTHLNEETQGDILKSVIGLNIESESYENFILDFFKGYEQKMKYQII